MTVVIGRIGGLLRPRDRDVPAARSASGIRPPHQVVIVLVLMVAVVSLAAAFLVLENSRLHATTEARRDALAAAQSHATEILSYDYRTIKEDIVQAKADITGKFRSEYSKHAQTVLLPEAKKQQIVVQAQVRSASVVDAEPDRVVVLLFVNQATTKKKSEENRVDQPRVQMTLEKVDGKWLVSKIASF